MTRSSPTELMLDKPSRLVRESLFQILRSSPTEVRLLRSRVVKASLYLMLRCRSTEPRMDEPSKLVRDSLPEMCRQSRDLRLGVSRLVRALLFPMTRQSPIELRLGIAKLDRRELPEITISPPTDSRLGISTLVRESLR